VSVDVEEIETAKSERFLAVVLAVFLLIGTIWFYVKVDDWIGHRDSTYSAAEQRVMTAQERAAKAREEADARLDRERTDLDLAKDALDIALAKGAPSAKVEASYDRALAEFKTAQMSDDQAHAAADRANAKADAVNRAHDRRLQSPARQWAVAGIRLGFIVLWFFASLRLTTALRQSRSRFVPLGFAGVGVGAITALVYATDYITDYIDPLDMGPIVLSAVGAVATIAAFVGLQRWLARRIPGRRVRNGECPFCGHPVRGDARHCEGCGRAVIASCTSCGAPRRVGAPHCGACGQA
jgi:hypothetical protein